ncbi:acyl-CoA thioesterase [Phenylobacterium montanum]|uniref:Acyl-CoA thioesterase n=1 Tax=Phenylobacterium montanum TaxID=2823693 RepID=A0A975IUJ2_9CAUL|nr:thioesterase family protein [Caulobacter sp. S6]QUD87810.1 acyl-CoA thioesterase [Caulobacter sp. S6]
MKPLEPPAGQQVFAYSIEPAAEDFDVNGHVNNVVYLRWVQEAATSHWSSRMNEAEQAAWAWVVLRHEIDYRRPLLPGETAQLRTWVGPRRGPRFIRYVRIDGPDGEVCAQASSDWCLIDAESRRPARVPDWMAERFG